MATRIDFAPLLVKASLLRFHFAVFLLVISQLSYADTSTPTINSYHSVSELKQAAKAFLTSLHAHTVGDLEITLSELDPRLKLNRCDHEFLIDTLNPRSTHLGRVSVQIRCTTPKPWKIYLNAQINLWQQVVVFHRSLTKGSSIQRSDLYLERHNLSRLRNGYFTSIEAVSDLTLNHNVRPGQIVTASSVSAPKLVRRGELVRLINERQGIRIESKGYAQSDGALGDRVRFKHVGSDRIILAQVTQRGIAKVSASQQSHRR